ncbi:copper chaperone PCu(A)C [Frankia sp. AgKG'84/4]|uniref:hypothetical protein n=1 Tax=Frankia sp. AgKG'84/4 TaxID=573490 RepID=UPI002010B1D0|nr:hypothetical protein [Frankia sp. AgKG'84/4]MCL9794485.1 hypothetical protein [Frankia sp. AgKG'84/4]
MSRRPGARFSSVIAGGAPAGPAVSRDPATTPDGAGGRGGFRRRMASRRVGVALLASTITTAGVAGCAAGTDALTNSARTTTNSVAGSVGSITLRNVYLAGPVAKGGSAPIVSAFFNASGDPDTLVAVSSPDAAGGRPSTPAQIPGGAGRVFIADGSAPSLQGFNQNLLVGSALPITFTFAKAGSVTLDVPVEPPSAGASSTAAASPSTEGSPSASPTAAGQTPNGQAAAASGAPSAGSVTPSVSGSAAATTASPTAGG